MRPLVRWTSAIDLTAVILHGSYRRAHQCAPRLIVSVVLRCGYALNRHLLAPANAATAIRRPVCLAVSAFRAHRQ